MGGGSNMYMYVSFGAYAVVIYIPPSVPAGICPVAISVGISLSVVVVICSFVVPSPSFSRG